MWAGKEESPPTSCSCIAQSKEENIMTWNFIATGTKVQLKSSRPRTSTVQQRNMDGILFTSEFRAGNNISFELTVV